MRAYLKKDGSGDVVVRFKSNEIVTINSQGDVTLARNNYTNTITLRVCTPSICSTPLSLSDLLFASYLPDEL